MSCRPRGRTTAHPELGHTSWYQVRRGDHDAPRGAWEHTGLPAFAESLAGRVAFAWHAMDAFYEEEERVLGHASDPYHRIDIRQTSRHLVVRAGDEVVAETHRPLVLYESGFAPRWYVPRDDVNEQLLAPVPRQTFCPYKGLCDYYDVGDAGRAAWSYRDAYREVDRVDDFDLLRARQGHGHPRRGAPRARARSTGRAARGRPRPEPRRGGGAGEALSPVPIR